MNEPGLMVYLEKQGIDASRVKVRGADETGYDYISVDEDGRPVTRLNEKGVLRLVTERHEWPDGVWAKVEKLLANKGLKDINE